MKSSVTGTPYGCEKWRFVLWMLVFVWPSSSVAEELIYHRDWVQVKSALSVIQLPALQRVVSQYETLQDAQILIRFPGGDEGNAWAIQVRSWLVSLGISLASIQLQPGSGVPDAISIVVEAHGLQ